MSSTDEHPMFCYGCVDPDLYHNDAEKLEASLRSQPSDEFNGQIVVNASANSPYVAESGRYVLIVANGCPFAGRTWATLMLLGLQDCIRIVKVFPGNLSDGWFFEAVSEEEKALVAKHPDIKFDSFNDGEENITHLKELYLKSNPNFRGKVSVPVLYDTKTRSIVNNSSIDISVIIATQFTAFRKQPTNCDLDVKSLELIAADKNSDAHRKTLKVVEDIAFRVSGAVYRIHFNPDQAEYEKLTREYFAVLDEFEALLSKQPYIMGENISLADVIMYASIIRLPLVYSTMFRVNLKPMNDITYPNLWGLVKRIHNTGNVGTCIVPRAVKVNYYSSKPLVEKAGKTIPIGPMCDLFDGVCY